MDTAPETDEPLSAIAHIRPPHDETGEGLRVILEHVPAWQLALAFVGAALLTWWAL